MAATTLQVAARPRDFVAVRGPEAAAYLERMVSNTVETLPVGGACEALLLTAKARVIAMLVVVRRAADDFLLCTEPGYGDAVRTTLLRARFAAKCEITAEEHRTLLMLGAPAERATDAALAFATADYGIPAVELVDGEAPSDATTVTAEELERLRILAGTPRPGREVDDRVLPAEAGLEDRAISFTKGCYPGQEPVARLHHRGHVNRTLRVLTIDGEIPPTAEADVVLDGKTVGRVTSTAPDPVHGVVALAYVRREVPSGAVLAVEGRAAHQLH